MKRKVTKPVKPTDKHRHAKTAKHAEKEHKSVATVQEKESLNTEGEERINRFIASCGLCSRREADRWISMGRVSVNGELITQPGLKISSQDTVKVDDKVVSKDAEKIYILYYKPKGMLCSRRDDRKRPLIYDQLDVPANVQSIGRLDMDSEGLLLLTSDGGLAQKLTHPNAKIPRQYRVRITSQLTLESMQKLRSGGIDMGDGDISDGWGLVIDSESKGHSWITVTIHRGRYREVRRTLKALGHEVRRLIRTQFGNMRLDLEIRPGQWRSLKNQEVHKNKFCC